MTMRYSLKKIVLLKLFIPDLYVRAQNYIQTFENQSVLKMIITIDLKWGNNPDPTEKGLSAHAGQ